MIVDAESKMTSEVHFLDASRPTAPLEVVEPRRQGVEYSVEHARHPGRATSADPHQRRRGRRTSPLLKHPSAPRAGPTGAPVVPHRPEVRLDASTPSPATWSSPSGTTGPRTPADRRLGGRVPHEVIDQPEAATSLTGAANPEFARRRCASATRRW